MMSSAAIDEAVTGEVANGEAANSAGRFRAIFFGIAKYLIGIILCLTPFTAVIVLGWLSRKLANDVGRRLGGHRLGSWPNFVLTEKEASVGRWSRLIGGLLRNVTCGLKAWIAIFVITAPFSLVWLGGWLAGWENSFSKGYELSGIWPSVSLAAVFSSLPVLALVPMAIAHQAVSGTISAVFEFRRIAALARSAGWSYLTLSILIGIGSIGVFGIRGLPVFAEQFSVRVASGSPQAIMEFAQQYKLVMTALLFTGLLVMRHVLARVYAKAYLRLEGEHTVHWIKTAFIFCLISLLWLSAVLLIYVSQFLNYTWWSWLNQPFTMLPWIGII